MDIMIVNPPQYVRPLQFERMTGVSVEAQKQKRAKGVWKRDREYRIGPDGNVWVDWRKCDEWVERGYDTRR